MPPRITAIFIDSYSSYHFVADTFGTSWYHSHYESQLIDGIFGPLVVFGPNHVPFDEDLGPIVIQDCKEPHCPELSFRSTDEDRFSHTV